jgi:hypothetical protein
MYILCIYYTSYILHIIHITCSIHHIHYIYIYIYIYITCIIHLYLYICVCVSLHVCVYRYQSCCFSNAAPSAPLHPITLIASFSSQSGHNSAEHYQFEGVNNQICVCNVYTCICLYIYIYRYIDIYIDLYRYIYIDIMYK